MFDHQRIQGARLIGADAEMMSASGAIARRGLAPFILVALAMTSLTAGTARASTPLLAGTNVITGSVVGAMKVRVPSRATIDVEGFSDYSIAGGGRFAGVVLADARGVDGTVLMVAEYNGCWSRGCRPQKPEPLADLKDPSGKSSNVVPAGDYTLYLLADGAPVRVTLRLHGLSGSTRLSPSAFRGLQIKTLTPQFAIGKPPLQETWVASGLGSIASRGGIVGTDFIFEGPTYAGSAEDVCLKYGRPPRRYLPGCPGSGSIPFLDLVSKPNYQAGLLTADMVRGNSWSVEAYYVAAALVRNANAASFWLSF